MTAVALLKLQKAGFTDQQVEALAEYMDSQAATTADIAELEIAIAKVRSDLMIETTSAHSDLDVKIAETKSELVKWVVGVGSVQVATILAVLKLLPGAHP